MNMKEKIFVRVTLIFISLLTSCSSQVSNVPTSFGSENTFLFRNDSANVAYVLEVKFNQSVDILTKGPFKDVDSLDEWETKYRFRDGAVLPGGEIEITVRAKKPGTGKISLVSYKWSFTPKKRLRT